MNYIYACKNLGRINFLSYKDFVVKKTRYSGVFKALGWANVNAAGKKVL